MAWDPLGRMLTIWRFWPAVQTALTCLIAGVQKAGLDVYVLVYEESLANSYCGGAGKRISRIRSVARFAPSHWRSGDGVRQWSRLALNNRGALSILDASFKFARASYLVSGEPWSTVRMEQRGFGEFCVSSAEVGVCAGMTSASLRMRQKKGFAFAVREGYRELSSGVGRVSERTKFLEQFQVHRCQVTCASLHRSIAPDTVFRVFKFG